ncbi:hypothetical protein CCACVL1_24774 [Corchorus capsularis]|uniref:Uncharacterized protein n=1 Tax=Corchorus capsularis TaxID=210143 RepID=A0A1R3GNA3_COCAP|nr:hypothetical protein CCACVL1_24774 [Corchorus capsularis]
MSPPSDEDDNGAKKAKNSLGIEGKKRKKETRNQEEDGVDEELNPKKLIWDNDDDNGELVTSLSDQAMFK